MTEIGDLPEYSSSSVKWRIPDFFKLSEKNGKRYYSPSFKHSDATWCFEIFPNGYRPKDSGWISLHIRRRTFKHAKTIVVCEVGMKGKNGKEYRRGSGHKCEFDERNLCWGWSTLIGRSDLLKCKSIVAPDDVLIIYCNFIDSIICNEAKPENEIIVSNENTNTDESEDLKEGSNAEINTDDSEASKRDEERNVDESEFSEEVSGDKINMDDPEDLKGVSNEKINTDESEDLKGVSDEKSNTDVSEDIKEVSDEKINKDESKDLKEVSGEKSNTDVSEDLKGVSDEKINKDESKDLKEVSDEKSNTDASEDLKGVSDEKVNKDESKDLKEVSKEKISTDKSEDLNEVSDEKSNTDVSEDLKGVSDEKVNMDESEDLKEDEKINTDESKDLKRVSEDKGNRDESEDLEGDSDDESYTDESEDSEGGVEECENNEKDIFNIPKGIKKITEDLKNLLLNEDSCDITLKVQYQTYRAHKLILQARSPVFHAILKYDTLERRRTGVVDIPDCYPGAFKVFLHYLYSGTVKKIRSYEVLDLYSVADKYAVDTLKTECANCMKKELSVKNFGDYIALAVRHNESALIEFATSFFIENVKEIILTDKWKLFINENSDAANELYIKVLNTLIPE